MRRMRNRPRERTPPRGLLRRPEGWRADCPRRARGRSREPSAGCCDMHTPMSVRSMGLTSSGHPRPDRVARLDHYAIGDYALSAPAACPATHRRPRDPSGPAGHRRAAGAAGRRLPSSHRLPDPIGLGSREWPEGGARHLSGQTDVGVTSDMLY